MSEDFLAVPMSKMLEENADMAVFGYTREGDYSCTDVKIDDCVLDNEELLSYYLSSSMSGFVWNKIFKTFLWDNIRFPSFVVYEDIAALHSILPKVHKCVCLSVCPYIYTQRQNSATRSAFRQSDMQRVAVFKDFLGMILENYPKYQDKASEVLMYSIAGLMYKILYWGTYRRDKETYEMLYSDFMTIYCRAAEKYPDNNFRVMKTGDSYLKAYCVDIIKRPQYFKVKSRVVGFAKRTARRILHR